MPIEQPRIVPTISRGGRRFSMPPDHGFTSAFQSRLFRMVQSPVSHGRAAAVLAGGVQAVAVVGVFAELAGRANLAAAPALLFDGEENGRIHGNHQAGLKICMARASGWPRQPRQMQKMGGVPQKLDVDPVDTGPDPRVRSIEGRQVDFLHAGQLRKRMGNRADPVGDQPARLQQ
ncbi:MAG: hypothetical protein EON55_12240, partial [Alphaproteobacteria bacterium]